MGCELKEMIQSYSSLASDIAFEENKWNKSRRYIKELQEEYETLWQQIENKIEELRGN
ncbi:hypothetical protein CPTPhageEI1_105 [Klebsiella phage EI]|nr:hypothetical protein CPTPhageEI1_105 [Klebsiella phage EI]